jgi:hypothetical protein
MIKKSNGPTGRVPMRPSKTSSFERGHHTTSRPLVPTLKQRLEAARTGYLAISTSLHEDLKANLLERVRLLFPNLRIGSFATEFEDTKDWENHLKSFMSDVDILLVGYDSTRVVGSGVRREMTLARSLNKLILLFDTDSNRPTMYFGFDPIEEDGKVRSVRLRTQKWERGATV